MIKHIAITLFCISSFLFSHCQVPCGIYDDAMRIHQIKEHTQTIIKASVHINSLSNENSGLNNNQLVRWVNTKELHATLIQDIISDYFLTQRIKFKNEGDSDRNKYIEMTTTLQQMLVSAMKCKQTVTIESANKLLSLTDYFSSIYFDKHGLKHLDELNHNE
jgi:nickel superoxide dismutase